VVTTSTIITTIVTWASPFWLSSLFIHTNYTRVLLKTPTNSWVFFTNISISVFGFALDKKKLSGGQIRRVCFRAVNFRHSGRHP
jgi:hypothetical protein